MVMSYQIFIFLNWIIIVNFSGFYDTMDAGYMDNEGYIFVVARDDDVINVAGHR